MDDGEQRANRSRRGRLVPLYSAEAEVGWLSSCLIDGERMVALGIERRLAPESFYVSAHGIVWAALVEMHGRRVPIGADTLAEELRAAGNLDAVGGFGFVVQVSEKVPTTAQGDYFLGKVLEWALARAKLGAAHKISESLQRADAEGVRAGEAALRELESEETGRLPAVVSAVAMEAKKLVKPPELVAGVLHRGRRMIVAGGSKSFKTWVLLDLALSVASGSPWWGMRTEGGRVLYVNFELPAWGLIERITEIAKAKGLAELPAGLDVWDCDGYATDIDELLPFFEARGVRGQYSLIILDPIYVCLGERDENSNSEVTQLMNRLARLARRTGAAVAFGHHFSKGNQSEKDARDRASGAGAWVRAPDTVLTLTAHEEEHAFRVDYVLRNLKPKEAIVVRWKHPCMEIAPGLNPGALKGPGRTKEFRVGDVAVLLDKEPLTYSQWERAAKKEGVSESTFKRLLNEAVEKKAVRKMGVLYMREGGAA